MCEKQVVYVCAFVWSMMNMLMRKSYIVRDRVRREGVDVGSKKGDKNIEVM